MLGFHNVTVGRTNEVAALTGFLIRKCMGVSLGQKKRPYRGVPLYYIFTENEPGGLSFPIWLIVYSLNKNTGFFPISSRIR